MLDWIFALDKTIILGIGNFQYDFLTPVMILFTSIWDMGILWILLTIVLLSLPSNRILGITLALGLFINLILGEWILKHLFDRPRPFQDFPTILLHISPPITSSFPSGHTSASWCFATIFIYYIWKKSKTAVITIWFLALAISISRVYLQVHYPIDILWWIFIGILSARLAIFLITYYQKNYSEYK